MFLKVGHRGARAYEIENTLESFKKAIELGVEAALQLNAQYLVPLYRFTHTRDVEKAHKNNLKIIVWTINTRQEVKEYIAKGVDGIASDKPDIF
jgi:glycerophosphoryl diester phosphodiesterase